MQRARERILFYVGVAILLLGILYGVLGQYTRANWFLLTYISVWALKNESDREKMIAEYYSSTKDNS